MDKDINKDSLLKKILEYTDIVERYVNNSNRFIFPGVRVYCKLNVYYSSTTSIAEIESIVQKFKKPRIHFFQISHSYATSPLPIGSLTGSVRNMAISHDFCLVFNNLFKLKHLGFWWTQPISVSGGEFSPKSSIYILRLTDQMTRWFR